MVQSKSTQSLLLRRIAFLIGVLVVARPLAADEQIVPLRTITYNVHLLPDVAAKIAGKRGASDYRAIAIGKRLADYDLMGINEAFDSSRSRAMVQTLQASSPTKLALAFGPGRSGRHLIGSGLVLLSRWPIIDTHTITYADASRFLTSGFKADGFAAKGALHARIQLGKDPNSSLDVFLTHLESRSDKARYKQLLELSRFIAEHADGSCPIVVMGDFNVAMERSNAISYSTESTPYQRMRRALSASGHPFTDVGELGTPRPFGTSNAIVEHGGRRIDYIFVSQPSANVNARLRALNTKTLQFHDDRVPEGSLSDHAAVSCDFTYCYRVASTSRLRADRR